MANKKLSDGVGKKIVEALKKQSEIEITPIPKEENLDDELLESFDINSSDSNQDLQDDNLLENFSSNDYLENATNDTKKTFVNNESSINLGETPFKKPLDQQFISYQQAAAQQSSDNFIKELDTFEIPSNIAVLKKLISQLPSGVTRHTGAQIIKQTMEALGISMKSVLQEAQQVQDGLNNSAKECLSTIQEYKKQIMLLEKQSQNHQRQYAALNELISLFVQTGL